jgi:hemerythrin-like domain-containing protein
MKNAAMEKAGTTLSAELTAEHRAIELVLDSIDELSARALKAGKLDGRNALEALDLVREFADKWHHSKEETLLFPAMARHGFDPDSGPVAVMLGEHREGRELVKRMREAATGAVNGKADAVKDFADAAAGYTGLLRGHIQKEDGILYPMADRVLPEEEQRAMMADALEVEKKLTGHGIKEDYRDKAERLAARLGVKPKPAKAGGKCPCCG